LIRKNKTFKQQYQPVRVLEEDGVGYLETAKTVNHSRRRAAVDRYSLYADYKRWRVATHHVVSRFIIYSEINTAVPQRQQSPVTHISKRKYDTLKEAKP